MLRCLRFAVSTPLLGLLISKFSIFRDFRALPVRPAFCSDLVVFRFPFLLRTFSYRTLSSVFHGSNMFALFERLFRRAFFAPFPLSVFCPLPLPLMLPRTGLRCCRLPHRSATAGQRYSGEFVALSRCINSCQVHFSAFSVFQAPAIFPSTSRSLFA